MSLLIKLALWLIWPRPDLWRCGPLCLIMAKYWPFKSILSWIEKLEPRLFHLQVERWIFFIAVVLPRSWYMLFGFQVVVNDLLLDRCFIICHCWWFIYLRTRLIFTYAAMWTTPHVPPSSVHHMSPPECFLDFYLFQLRGCLSVVHDLLMRLIYHSRIVNVWWLLCHLK